MWYTKKKKPHQSQSTGFGRKILSGMLKDSRIFQSCKLQITWREKNLKPVLSDPVLQFLIPATIPVSLVVKFNYLSLISPKEDNSLQLHCQPGLGPERFHCWVFPGSLLEAAEHCSIREGRCHRNRGQPEITWEQGCPQSLPLPAAWLFCHLILAKTTLHLRNSYCAFHHFLFN